MARVIVRLKNWYRLTNHKILLRKYSCDASEKSSSTLYIPGSKASEAYSYFSPYLDFNSRFMDVSKTQEEMDKRGTTVSIDNLKSAWEMYKIVNTKKATLQLNQEILSQQIRQLSKLQEHSDEQRKEIEAFKTQLQIIKKDYKALLKVVWQMEEDIIVRCLRLPNKLHEKTPVEKSIILDTFGEASTFISKYNHIHVGEKLGLLEYLNKWQYFLLGEAAVFEQGVMNLAGTILNNNKFIRISGLDFSRSSIVEGSGLNHENLNSAFLLKSVNDDKDSLNPLFLVGNASLISQLALNTKMKCSPSSLPVYFYSTGREYKPELDDNSDGLFGVCQESVVHIFCLAKDDVQCESAFVQVMNVAKQLYSKLCDHYRIVVKPAEELEPAESLRVSFEVWSSYYQKYMEVGHVAMHSDYLSKRLLIIYQTSSGKDYPSTISGTLLSVPKLLGCMLEQDLEKCKILEKVNTFIPTIVSR